MTMYSTVDGCMVDAHGGVEGIDTGIALQIQMATLVTIIVNVLVNVDS